MLRFVFMRVDCTKQLPCALTQTGQQLPRADKFASLGIPSALLAASSQSSIRRETARLRLPDRSFSGAPPARTPTIPRAAPRGCPRLVALRALRCGDGGAARVKWRYLYT